MEEAENKENKVMTIANVSKESRRPLDWQMTKQNLSERGQYLLETGLWSDCTFVVGLPPSQRDIRVRKTTLEKTYLNSRLHFDIFCRFFGVTKCF